MKNILLKTAMISACFTLFYFQSAGQPVSPEVQGIMPISFNLEKETILKETPIIVMPVVDREALKAVDEINDSQKERPWRFGKVHQVSLSPFNSGVWSVMDDGTKIWRLEVKCPGALSINILFGQYKLPPGSRLFVFSKDKSQLLGPFTDFNNQDDNYFAVSLVLSESIIIEYNEPANVEFEGILKISEIIHGYIGIPDYVKAFGDSGACNVNVACSAVAATQNEICSAAMIATSHGSATRNYTLANWYKTTTATLTLIPASHDFGDVEVQLFQPPELHPNQHWFIKRERDNRPLGNTFHHSFWWRVVYPGCRWYQNHIGKVQPYHNGK